MSNVTFDSRTLGGSRASAATDRKRMPPPSALPLKKTSSQYSLRSGSSGVTKRSTKMSHSSLANTWQRNRTKTQRETSLAGIEYKVFQALDQGAQNEKTAACSALNYAERRGLLVYRFATYFLSRLGTNWSLDEHIDFIANGPGERRGLYREKDSQDFTAVQKAKGKLWHDHWRGDGQLDSLSDEFVGLCYDCFQGSGWFRVKKNGKHNGPCGKNPPRQ
jgi:hypothetical protein